MKAHACLTRLFALVVVFPLLAGTAFAAGIKVVPSKDRVSPGESFYVDIIAENIPATGLGAVQFQLDVDAPGSIVTGVADLNQAGDANVCVASPLLMGAPTATRSGLGELFLGHYQGNSGILVMDNETFSGGAALYTFAHTNGAKLPSGSGSVARFHIKVGSRVAAERIRINLSRVMLLDGGAEYPLDYNLGATIPLSCSVEVPDLAGLTLGQVQTALAGKELSVGNVYEIANPGNARPLGVVLEQSVAAGAFAECGSVINLAINQAPADVTGLSAADLAADDTGKVVLTWSPSASSDVTGYRVYRGGTLLAEVNAPHGATATVGNLPIGIAVQIRVTALDGFGNESAGALVTATALDDVPPVISFNNVADGVYYSSSVHPRLQTTETHPAGLTAMLNGRSYDWSPISADGIYTLSVTMVDTSGNSTTESIRFTVDGTAPVITVPNMVEGGYLNAPITPEILIEDLAGDDQKTVVTLDGQPYAPGTPIEGEGSHVLIITATDKAGHQSSLTVTFTLDLTMPTIGVEGVADGAFINTDVTPVVTITEANPAESSLTLNGQPFVSGTNISQEGVYVLVASCVDLAGNHAGVNLSFIIDKTAPVSNFELGAPKYSTESAHYVTGSNVVTLSGVDEGSAPSGVEKIAYTFDGADPWTAYTAPFVLSALPEGPHRLAWRTTDMAGNREGERRLELIIDNTPPQTVLQLEGASHDAGDRLIVSALTRFNLAATDSYSGIASTEYRIDGGAWISAAAFSISLSGAHLIEYRSTDRLGHVEEPRAVTVTADTTAPVTDIAFENQSYIDGDKLLLTAASQIILAATDDLAGVAGTYYRYDDQTDWRPYAGNLRLTELPNGSHVLHFYSEDHVDNAEAPRSVAFSLVGAKVEVELVNRPRVLVWTDDPGDSKGWPSHGSASYTLDDIRNLVARAMDSADAYVELVTKEEDFRENFRSGIFNVVMVLSQKERMDTGFLRELRDAVQQGSVGLLVSSWGNNVHSVLRDMFGIHFVGAMSMNEEQRELHLFDSEVAEQAVLTASGRLLKTRLDGGVMAGMIPGESRCQGVRGVSFAYPATLEAGDRITVSVYTEKGGRNWKDKDKNKLNLVDQEQMTVDALPTVGGNNHTGNPAGDLTITSAVAKSLFFSLAGPYGYLGSSYLLEVRIERADGSVVESGLVPLTPNCDAHLWAGMTIGPFQVTAVDEDRIRTSPDLPAVVLNQFGAGRTVFLAYDILESARKDAGGVHAGLLGNSANYLVPESTGPEPAGIGLIQTTVSFEGAGMDLVAIDALGPGLTHLSLFGLRAPPLEYRFSLEESTQATYRYFVRFPDQVGDYAKKTELFLELDGTAVSHDTYAHVFTVPVDSTQLLRQAMGMVEDLQSRNFLARLMLIKIRSDLQAIGSLRRSTRADYEKILREVDQVILQVKMLPFDADGLLKILARYRRIMQALRPDAAGSPASAGHGSGWWRPKKRELYGPVPIDLLKRNLVPCYWR